MSQAATPSRTDPADLRRYFLRILPRPLTLIEDPMSQFQPPDAVGHAPDRRQGVSLPPLTPAPDWPHGHRSVPALLYRIGWFTSAPGLLDWTSIHP